MSSLVNLREVRLSDKEKMLSWRNSDNVRPYMYNDHVIQEDEHSKWFDRMLYDKTKKYWIIELESNPVGVANLTNIDTNNESCDWAFYIFDPNTRGKGVGSFVEKYILSYVFNDLKLKKLNCEVLETNAGVVKMHEKFGFVQEGFFRNAIKKNDNTMNR